MSDGQWVFMASALKRIEEERLKEVDVHFERFRQILIGLLGLRIGGFRNEDGTPKDIKDVTEEDLATFTPLLFYVARPEVLQGIQKKFEEQMSASQGINDRSFEELSAAMAANPDMEPLDVPVVPIDQLFKQSQQFKHMEDLLVSKTPPPAFVGDPGKPRKKIRFVKPGDKK